MKRKILYPLLIIVIFVLGYINYYKEEKGIKKLEEVIETTNVSYETSGYFIEAKKQFDNLEAKESNFENASAKFKDMVLSGDNILLDSSKNLFLKNNVTGKKAQEWEFFTKELNYNSFQDTIKSFSGIKLINNLNNVTVKSKAMETNSKFNFIKLNGNIEIKNNNLHLCSDKGIYTSKNKTFILSEDGKYFFSNKKEKIDGTFIKAEFNLENKNLEMYEGFDINYGKITLKGTKMWYNDESKKFEILENPVVILNNYKIVSKKIENPNGKNYIHIRGPIKGENFENSFIADKGYYSILEKKLYLEGNIIIILKNSEKITAEKLIYDINTKKIHCIGKNSRVNYSFEDRKAAANEIIYDTVEKKIFLEKGYVYEDKIYKSKGKKLEYDFPNKKGVIYNGNFIIKNKNEKILGEKIVFDIDKQDYFVEKNVEISTGSYVIKGQKLDYLTSKGFAHFLTPFEIINLKDKSVISGKNAKYNIKTFDLESEEEIFYNNDKEEISIYGKSFSYNLNSKKGEILSKVIYQNKKDNIYLSGDKAFFEKDSFFRIENNLNVETVKGKIKGDKAYYNLKTKIVAFPGRVDFKSENNKMKGSIYNSLYDVKTRILKGNSLNITSEDDIKIKSDEVIYNSELNDLNLQRNIKIVNKNITLKSEKLKYNTETRKIDILEPFKLIYDKNLIIKGRKGNLDIEGEKISGENVEIISKKNESFVSNKVLGNMKDMNFDFIGNVEAKIFELEKKSKKTIPILYTGKFVKIFFKKENDAYEVLRIEGKEKSIISRENEKFYSDFIEMDLNRNVLYAGKNNKIVFENKYGKTFVEGDIFYVDNILGIAKIKGNIHIENINKNGEKTFLNGDESIINKKENKIEIIDNVKVEDNRLLLKADKIIYNRATNKAKAFGNVSIKYKEKQ